MTLSPDNPVVALCAAGIAREGEAPAEARQLFEQAWDIRKDDFDAAVAAHYVARHQSTPDATLQWNQRALDHAERVEGHHADEMMASLHLNLADSLAKVGDVERARHHASRADHYLDVLPEGGYRNLIAQGIGRLHARLTPADR